MAKFETLPKWTAESVSKERNSYKYIYLKLALIASGLIAVCYLVTASNAPGFQFSWRNLAPCGPWRVHSSSDLHGYDSVNSDISENRDDLSQQIDNFSHTESHDTGNCKDRHRKHGSKNLNVHHGKHGNSSDHSHRKNNKHHGKHNHEKHSHKKHSHKKHSHKKDSNCTLGTLRKHAVKLVSKSRLNETIEHYFNAGPHLAAQNEELVNYTVQSFNRSGYDAWVETYSIWLNYPVNHRVALLKEDGSVKTELKLEEPPLEEDPTTSRIDRIPTFHGYSAIGNVTGKLVYANKGYREDYDKLVKKGINLTDAVVLVRYGGIFRGLKVKFAEELGAAAVLIYSDPAEDGNITEANGYKAYPNGPARHPESVQRGSVQDLSHSPGDPTTPGFPSIPENDGKRLDPQGIPGIPSIPLSYSDALPLLKALNGHGLQFSDWKGALKGVDYNTGPSKLKVLVENNQDYDFRPNHDVIARLQGESDDEIIIGNHRDAWILGGADPNSGTAILLEVARVFGKLVKRGWKPKRSIVFASWDGEEYGLLGSTEWGEHHADQLKRHTVAYINCDVGVSGKQLEVSANPLLHNVIEKSAENVEIFNTTLSDYWGGNRTNRIKPLGSGSDYTVFQDHLGIPSLDVGFVSAGDSPVYHYHSNYDSYHWMQKFGDPDLVYHEAVTKFVILSAIELIESEILPLNVVDLSKSVNQSVNNLLKYYDGPLSENISDLYEEIKQFQVKALQFKEKLNGYKKESKRLSKGKGFWNGVKWAILQLKISNANSKLRKLDQNFLYSDGLDDRPWFKHIVYAPGRYTGYAGQVLPGIAEALEDNNEEKLLKWIQITAEAIKSAANSL